ncbi:MAG: HAD family phosphatase [Rikenellaceae bacterium]|nr:HAD family phosphatase [Rikenellaceae bacterium]
MKLIPGFPSTIKNIIFDIGNVLIDLDIPATLRAFEALRIGGLRPEDIHPHQSGFFLDYEVGRLDDAGFLQAIRQGYDCSGVTDRQILAAWNAMLLDPQPEQFRLIRKLGRHYRLFVLSNTNHQHISHLHTRFERICGYPLESLFEKCFYSHRLGLRKPDPDIYRQVIAQTGVMVEQTLFIDDNLCNIFPADALSLKTYHLTSDRKLSELFA